MNNSLRKCDIFSDTEYLLRITTTLYNNAKTESGQFKFKTPRGKEMKDMKNSENAFQSTRTRFRKWMSFIRTILTLSNCNGSWNRELKKYSTRNHAIRRFRHIHKEKVAGYDVYFTDNKVGSLDTNKMKGKTELTMQKNEMIRVA